MFNFFCCCWGLQKNSPWLSVPQFGDWDQKGGGTIPDYSMDFTKIREMRKQNKRDPSRASLGNEDELVKPPPESATATAKLTTVHSEKHHHFSPTHHHQPRSPSVRFQTTFVYSLTLNRVKHEYFAFVVTSSYKSFI